MTNHCLKCFQTTDNPKFCSVNCAASYNNTLNAKIKKRIVLCACSKPVSHRRGRFCLECTPKDKLQRETLQDLKSRSKTANFHSQVRGNARTVYRNSGLPNCCSICGYTNHIEICHIKPVSEFSLDTKISIVNEISNLVALCPNHHWELDNGLVDRIGIEPTSS
jgi:hypothetical protein